MYSWYCFILNFVRVHKDDKEDMEMAFKEVAIESLEFNPFTKISKEWMLVTAGDEKKSNTMTASWGWCRNHVGKEYRNCIYPPTEIHEEIHG